MVLNIPSGNALSPVWDFTWTNADLLFSVHYSYILRVPFDSEEESGIVYVWIGYKADPEEARLAEEIADDMYGVSIFGVITGIARINLRDVVLI